MYVIVVGGGGLGRNLVQLAVEGGHDVALIDRDAERCARAAESFDGVVLNADIAEGGILEEAGVAKADAVIACTSDDSANLMAMMLAAEREVPTRVSVVNDASHRPLFERLAVHVLASPEEIVARHLYGVVTQPRVQDVVPLGGGAEAFEVTVAEGSKLLGLTLAEAAARELLGAGLLVVSVRREGRTFVAGGGTTLEAGDEVTVFCQSAPTERQVGLFTG